MTPEQQENFFYVWPKLGPTHKNEEYNNRRYAEFRWYWAEVHNYHWKRHLSFLRGLDKNDQKLAPMAYNAFLVQSRKKDMRWIKPEELGFCVCQCIRCWKLCRPVRSGYYVWPIQTVDEYDASKTSVFSSYFCRSCLTKTQQEDRRIDEIKSITKLCSKLMRETKHHGKNQNNRAVAGVSCEQPIGSVERPDGH